MLYKLFVRERCSQVNIFPLQNFAATNCEKRCEAQQVHSKKVVI